MKILIREKKNPKEIEALWKELNALHKEVSSHFKTHFESFTFQKRCEQLNRKERLKVFVASADGENIGYCIATKDDDAGEVDSLFISERYRGHDVGNQLMQNALNWLTENRCSKIVIQVAEGNESAIGFYEKFGFKKRFTTLQLA